MLTETLCTNWLPWTNFAPQPLRYTPIPTRNNVGIAICKTCFVCVQHWKGGWGQLTIYNEFEREKAILKLALISNDCLNYFIDAYCSLVTLIGLAYRHVSMGWVVGQNHILGQIVAAKSTWNTDVQSSAITLILSTLRSVYYVLYTGTITIHSFIECTIHCALLWTLPHLNISVGQRWI